MSQPARSLQAEGHGGEGRGGEVRLVRGLAAGMPLAPLRFAPVRSAPAPSQVTISRRRRLAGTAVIASARTCRVIGGGVRAGAARAQHPGQRLRGVVAVSQQRVMAFSELNDHGVLVSGSVS